MNSLQRVVATMQGQPVDRRAVAMMLSLYGAKLTECPLADYYTQPERYVEGQQAVRETFGPDILFGPFAVTAEGEAFGSEVHYVPGYAPNLRTPAIASHQQIAELTIPDVDGHPRLLYFRQAVRALAQAYAGEVPVAAIVLSPADLPAMIMGIDGWLQTLLFEPAAAQRMLAKTVSFFVQWANALLTDGAAVAVVTQAFTNTRIMPRPLVAERILPAVKHALSQLRGPALLHHVGAPMLPLLDLMADLPNVAGFVVDSRDDLARARQIIGPGPTLAGNLDGPTLGRRTPNEIAAACAAILADRRDDASFLLATSGADVPPDTPAENLHAIREAVEASAGKEA